MVVPSGSLGGGWSSALCREAASPSATDFLSFSPPVGLHESLSQEFPTSSKLGVSGGAHRTRRGFLRPQGMFSRFPIFLLIPPSRYFFLPSAPGSSDVLHCLPSRWSNAFRRTAGAFDQPLFDFVFSEHDGRMKPIQAPSSL